MSFHKNDEPGKKVAFSEAKELIEKNLINLGDSDERTSLWGFFSAEILNDILNEPDCVGIRLYNAAFFLGEFLIIVGVKSDGSEIQENSDGESGYIISTVRHNDQSVLTFEFNRVDRNTAAESAWNAWAKPDQTGGEDISFASYFSAQTVGMLLGADDCNGVNFYVVGLLRNGKFPFTHMAVPTKLIDFKQFELRGQVSDCVICPDPCPPRCAPEDTNVANATDRGAAAFNLAESLKRMRPVSDLEISESSFDRYLERWM